jgi:(E)-4-hydroxy-3-methyl-but-2-enyl pyrophosphate reductase
MKVILAKTAGFCMGVQRAVDTTLKLAQEQDHIATFGPLIHNPQVLEQLREKGVTVLDEIPEKQDGVIVVRAHGIPPNQKQQLETSGAKIHDATCPRVMNVQAIIRKYKKQDFFTIIIGDKNHAEVIGLMGYADPDVAVVSDESDIENLIILSSYIIVSQTTQDEVKFNELTEKILECFPGGNVFNTICDSTHNRQAEIREICQKVDAMIVVGGKGSANTQRLGLIAEEMNVPVFMVETKKDLDLKLLDKFERVGISAGASTPTCVIDEIVCALKDIEGDPC